MSFLPALDYVCTSGWTSTIENETINDLSWTRKWIETDVNSNGGNIYLLGK